MQGKITESSVKKLEASDKPYELVDMQLRGFLLRVQPSGVKTYYFAYRNSAGKRVRIKIGKVGAISVAQARDLAEKHSAAVVQGKDVQSSKKEEKKKAAELADRTLDKFLEKHYGPWAVLNRKTGQKTIDTIKRNFSDLFSKPLHEISLLSVERWRTDRLKAGVKAATINRDVTTLRGLLTKAVEWEVLEIHPLRKLKPLQVDSSPKVRYLSAEEETRLLGALKAREEGIRAARDRGNRFRQERGYELLPSLREVVYADRLMPMVVLSLKTGMRQGELFDLCWKDVSFDESLITVRAEVNKSNKTRHIPLSQTAKQCLLDWHKQSEEIQPDSLVFPARDGARLDNVKRSWTQVLKDAKISTFRWHDMRHDFASKLVMKGAPLNTVRDLCGHADLSTTLRYAHLAPEHKAEAIALLG